ncbi:MAG: hypothetical protein LBE82_05480 [Chitinophagaceae bacterium]|jgi:hypothetical protein|nr:hypothetical protein [Chitinophagaceae bacterium]
MEYKYYVADSNSYKLKPRMVGVAIFVAIVMGLLALSCLYVAINKPDSNGFYIGALVCALFAFLPYYRTKRHRFIIIPAQKKVLWKNWGKEKEYSFNDFLNFHTTVVRNNFIVSQRHVSAIFNDNGKNNTLLIGVVFGKKAVERLISETSEIMGKS